MAKDLTALVNKLQQFGKIASAEPAVSDPTEKGSPGTFPEDRTIAPLPGPKGEGILNDVPAVSSTEMAGEHKVEGGTPTGVPSAQPFQESATPSTAKAAGLIAGATELRNKLANFGKAALETAILNTDAVDGTPSGAKAKVKGEDEATGTEDKEASYIPGDALMRVAFHLTKSAAGLSLVNQALDEVLGQEAATLLVKQAADETAEFLRDYTVSRLQQVDAEAQAMKQAAEQRQADAEYAELTKGATAEQLQAIDTSALLIKRATELFADHPVGSIFAAAGFAAASKAAAAMEQGMPPEAAAEMAAQEGSGAPADGPPSPEELEAAISVLVEQGILTPEQAQQLVAELMGGGGEGMPPGAEGGAPPAGPEAEKMAAADAALQKIANTIFA